MRYKKNHPLKSFRFALAPVSLGILLSSFNVSATNVISLENLKFGAKHWRHKDMWSAEFTERQAKGQIPKVLPEVHDVATYCAPENAATNPFAKDDCISAYTNLPSVNVGQSIKFKVSVNPAPQTFSIEFFRMGWYDGAGATSVQVVAPMAGVKQPDCPMNATTGETECNWSDSYTLNVPSTWTSGVYSAILTNQTGYKTEVLFVVRDDARVADFLYSVPVLTYAAYNNYPSWSPNTSKSLYEGGSTGANTVVGTVRAAKSSLERPQHHQFGGWLGSDWTEIQLVAWLEKNGYNVKYITDVDLDAMNKPDLLNYKGLLFGGHSEYWTKKMYDNVESARDAGVNLAFFGANAVHWQVRLEKSSTGKSARSVVGYKDTATSNIDPITDPTLKTKHWTDLGRPEQTLVGVQYPDAGWKLPTTGQRPLVINDSSSWVFDNTSLNDGSSIPYLVGYEIDNLDPNLAQPKLLTPTSQTILAESPFVNFLGSPLISQTSIYQAPSKAWVFGAGTMSWSWGLGRLPLMDANGTVLESYENADIQQATKNIMDKFLSTNNVAPPAAVTVFEHYNYAGVSQQFGVGKYRAISGQFDVVGNERISSLTVPAGYAVKLCQAELEFGYSLCKTYNSSTKYVDWYMNDQTSYIEVFKLPATSASDSVAVASLFKDGNFYGRVQHLGLGEYRAISGQLKAVGNDAISSIFVPQGYAVKACEHEPEYGYGRCATYKGAVGWVGNLNDKISYINFYKL